VVNVYFFFLNHAWTKTKRNFSIALCHGRRWLAKMRRATNVLHSVGRPISNLSHDPRIPATKFAKRTAQGRNSQWTERTL